MIPPRENRGKPAGRRRLFLLLGTFFVVLLFAWAAWLGTRALLIKSQLNSAAQVIPQIKSAIESGDATAAKSATDDLRGHTSAAKSAVEDPVWSMSTFVPFLGPNLAAISEVARTSDDVATLGLEPLVGVFDKLDWKSIIPGGSGADLSSLETASPTVSSAAQAVRFSALRLQQIDVVGLLPQVAEPLSTARAQLASVTGPLDSAAHAAEVLPGMLGSHEPRHYLLMIQNNAELRASGGIPGALAVMNVDGGKVSLGEQSSASDLGAMSPVLPIDPVQQQIFTSRLGKYMQDVNLTPDFPSAAQTAKTMWDKKKNQNVDGVISIDPVALSYVLEAIGPIDLQGPEVEVVKASGLPVRLTSANVVQTLLSDVYAKIQNPKAQDAYFAGVAQEIFRSLTSSHMDGKQLIKAITKASSENRLLIWSNRSDEQETLAQYPLSGAISGASVQPSQFGLYFNDGTGAKMDYYVRRTVQLVKDCPSDGGYQQVTVRVTSTNTAPLDAAKSLPAYVTGGGIFGVPPGAIQTNVVAYGPVQANVESASMDGQKAPFAPYLHANRPVGVISQILAPGESRTVEFTFGKIVQHTEPNVVVTPTVQHVKDVILPTENASCDPGQ